VLGDYTQSITDTWRELVGKYVIEDAPIEPAVTITADENWVTFTMFKAGYRTASIAAPS
jgi:hypothetical protein